MNEILENKHTDICDAWNSLDFNNAFNIAVDLLKDDPENISALYTVAAYYCNNGELETARKFFVYLIELLDAAHINKLEYVICSLIRIEFNLGNFEMAYEYLKEAKLLFPYISSETEKLEQYLYNKLNGFNDKYDLNECLEHILDKHSYYSYEDNTGSDHTLFNNDINIRKLFFDASKELETIPRKNGFDPFILSYNVRFNDIYFLKMPNCGYSLDLNKSTCNYVQIITIPFSKKIISMYPCLNVPISANKFELKNNDEVKIKVKKTESLNQIDKFYKKWRA